MDEKRVVVVGDVPPIPPNPLTHTKLSEKTESLKSGRANTTDDSKQSENDNNLSQFFAKPDYAPPVPFTWPENNFLRLRDKNVTSLVRNSCAAVSRNLKYMEINHEYLVEYATILAAGALKKQLPHVDFNTIPNLSERVIVNMTCLFVTLSFGSGFRPLLNDQMIAAVISNGVRNIHKRYPALDTESLSKICSIEEIGELFEIEYKNSAPLTALCDMLRKSLAHTVHVLNLKQRYDFAAYIYYHIDLAWIKSQTADLADLTVVEWNLNESHMLGLELAPTKNELVRRTVIVDFKATDDDPLNLQNNEACKKLVAQKAFLYAINDEVVYNKPFDYIIDKINRICEEISDEAREQQELLAENPDYVLLNQRTIALQFGLHLDSAPNAMQALLFNLVNDFHVLNDQYLYRHYHGKGQHLRIYFFQRAQLMVMELYYNLWSHTSMETAKNGMFNFRDIDLCTCVVGDCIPFLLFRDGVIKIKDEYKDEFEQYIDGRYILRSSDLEVEIRACAIRAVELILEHTNAQSHERKDGGIGGQTDINMVELTHFLWDKSTEAKYDSFERYYTRDTVYY